MAIELTDDGTMDTVLRCTKCGEEMRYNYANEPDDGTDDYDAFVAWAIEDAESEHECASDGDEDSEPTEPTEGDIITMDHETFYQDGRLILDGRNRFPGIYYEWIGPSKPQERIGPCDDYRAALRAYMDRVQYWPNCWFVSDHGNAHLINLSEERAVTDEHHNHDQHG